MQRATDRDHLRAAEPFFDVLESPAMAETNRCGPHTELVNNGTVRVTRCGCGTVHMTMIPSGVTVRLSAEHFRLLAGGIRIAAEKLDEAVVPRIDSSCVN